MYTGSIGMYSLSDVDPVSGRLEEDAEAHPGNHYGVYKRANRGPPVCTGPTPACRASGSGR